MPNRRALDALQRLDRARRNFRRAVLTAHEAGASKAELARELGDPRIPVLSGTYERLNQAVFALRRGRERRIWDSNPYYRRESAVAKVAECGFGT
jgi:hypothetical protein